MNSNTMNESHSINESHFHSNSVVNLVKYSYGLTIFLLVLNLVFTLMTLVGNILLLLLVKVYYQLRIPSNFLLASLAAVGLLNGLILQIGNMISLYRGIINKTDAVLKRNRVLIFEAMAMITTFATAVHLCFITLDRYIAIKYSLRYVSIVTTFRVKCGIAAAWIVSIFVGICFSSLPIHEGYRVVFHMLLLLAAFFMISLYGRIYFISRKHAKQITAHQLAAYPGQETLNEHRGLKTVALFSFILIISYLPFTILTAELKFSKPSSITESHNVTRDVFRQILIVLRFLSAAINPLLYFFRNETTRIYTKKLFRSILQKLKCY